MQPLKSGSKCKGEPEDSLVGGSDLEDDEDEDGDEEVDFLDGLVAAGGLSFCSVSARLFPSAFEDSARGR